MMGEIGVLGGLRPPNTPISSPKSGDPMNQKPGNEKQKVVMYNSCRT